MALDAPFIELAAAKRWRLPYCFGTTKPPARAFALPAVEGGLLGYPEGASGAPLYPVGAGRRVMESLNAGRRRTRGGVAAGHDGSGTLRERLHGRHHAIITLIITTTVTASHRHDLLSFQGDVFEKSPVAGRVAEGSR